MTEIRFYHLHTQTLEQALPAILMKALSGGRRVVVRFADEPSLAQFDDHLWTYHPDAFLPHGVEGGAQDADQPVILTTRESNPNKADMLVLCDQQTVPGNVTEFSLCCDFIDGRDPAAIESGRARWKTCKEAGHALTYWQQTETGGWEQKA